MLRSPLIALFLRGSGDRPDASSQHMGQGGGKERRRVHWQHSEACGVFETVRLAFAAAHILFRGLPAAIRSNRSVAIVLWPGSFTTAGDLRADGGRLLERESSPPSCSCMQGLSVRVHVAAPHTCPTQQPWCLGTSGEPGVLARRHLGELSPGRCHPCLGGGQCLCFIVYLRSGAQCPPLESRSVLTGADCD